MTLPSAFDLKGRRALITGSTRGIGASIALALAEAGADVAFHSLHHGDGADDTVSRAAAFGIKTTHLDGDLGEDGVPSELFTQAVRDLGGVDILVLNASVQIPKDWLEITRFDFDRQMTVNFRASFELMQRAVPAMVDRKWGRVLTLGSVQEQVPNPEMRIYSSLKNAQTALVVSLAKQYAAQGVTFNNLAPGVIETDRYRDRVTTAAQAERVLSWIPAGRVGQPADCAGAALLLCSDAGAYITGQTLFVDGGMSL